MSDHATTEPARLSGDQKSMKGKDGVPDLEAVASTEVGQLVEYSDEEYNRVARKIDMHMMPIMFFLYGIQQTDKTSISVQALFGMETDLNLHGQQYQWLTTIFYLTYLLGEFPSTWLMQKLRIGRVLTCYIICWAVCLLCISACHKWSQVLVIRALQGFFESNISPGFLLITGSYYKSKEHASRSLIWQSSEGVFSIIANLMLYGIARHIDKVGGLAAWRCISLFLGSLTLAGAIFAFFILDSPHDAMWLTREEKKIAISRVMENQIGEDAIGKEWDWEQFFECFRDPQVYFTFLNTFLSCIPNGAFTTFSSLIYVTFGFNDWEAMLYGHPRDAVYTISFIAVAIYVQRYQNQRMYVMIMACIIPFAGMLVMSLLPNEERYKWLKWVMFNLTVLFSLSIFLGWSFITSNVAGRTKRTTVSSLVFISYCTGNMVGSQVFRTSDAPRYVNGTIACSACFGIQVLVIILWRLWYMRENRRRDRDAAASGLSKEEQLRLGAALGEQNVTDRKNPHFRYVM